MPTSPTRATDTKHFKHPRRTLVGKHAGPIASVNDSTTTEDFFRRALDAVSQAAVGTDERGLVCYWNEAADQMFGYSRAEAHGRHIADLVIPADQRAAALERTARVLAGQPYLGDWNVNDKSGREFPAHVTSAAVTDAAGRSIGLLGLVDDVTARRATEQQMRRLAAIVESSDDAIIEMDLTGVVRSANAAVEAVFGYAPAEIIGQNVSLVVPPEFEADMRAAVAALRAGRSVGVLSTTRRRKDGSVFQSSLRLSPVRDDAGDVVGVSGITRDVTAEAENRELLEDSEKRSRARFDQVAIAQAMIDPIGRFVTVNDALCTLLGRERRDIVGASIRELRHTSDDAHDADALEAVYAGLADSGSCERMLLAPDGSAVPVLVSAALLRGADGAPQEIFLVVQDLTARLAAERALRKSEARYRLIAETAQEGIWAIGMDARTLYANRKLVDILGVPHEALRERTAVDILNCSDLVAEKLRRRQERGSEEYEVRYQFPDGTPRVLHFSASVLPSESGEPVGSLGMVTDVTAARLAEDELRHRALHDELTGLPNRALLADRLEHALARQGRDGRPVAVLLADLDQFKLVNDSWGHAAGDDLLIQVAARLTSAVRPSDTVSRFGGDEFVIVSEGTDEQQAGELATRLIAAFADPIDVGTERVYVGASIGIAVSPPSNAVDLLRYADTAMYAAKSDGRGRYRVFDAALATQSADRLELSRDLRDALGHDQLTLHYQPVVELETGRILGVEALARWNHPTRGAVPPDVFVAVAEASGLAIPFDCWVLQRACRDYPTLRATLGDSTHMAVNISARHLGTAGLETTVLDALRRSQMPPDALTLEVTESALMDDPDEARALLERLRGHGVSTAIDDFGTGFSSLSHLTVLPVSTLKIDRSFVEHIAADASALAIVTSILTMAKTMGLATIAEGIETVDQLNVLRELGCPSGQGYLWSPARSLDELIITVQGLADCHFPVLPPYPAAA